MTNITHLRPGRLLRAGALAAALVLAGCGGGSKKDAGDPWLGETQAAAGDRARIASVRVGAQEAEPATTLADYAVERTQWGTVLGFPGATAEEMLYIHRRSVERGIAQLLPQLLVAGNGLALPALEASLVDTVAAAARGDTLAELREHHPLAPGYYSEMVETHRVDRSVWAPAGTPLLGSFLQAIDRIEPLPPLGSWEGSEVTRRDDPGLVAALDGFSTESVGALSLGADTRLLVIDHLRERFGFASAPKLLADGVFVGGDGTPRVMPMLQLPAIRHEGSGYVAHLASSPSYYRHVVTIRPATQDLHAFASSGALAAAIAELAQMTRQRTLVALPAGTMVLPVLEDLSLDGHTVPARGLSLATSEVNANLRGLDGGGTYLRLAQLPSRLSISALRVEARGGHAAAFNFSRANLFGPGADASVFITSNPFTFDTPLAVPPCPRAEPDLRSLFIAVFDDDLRLVSIAALGRLDGARCQ